MAAIDTERFRLRRFVERLVQLGECEVHEQPIDLIDVGAVLDGNPRATWFKAVGPEKAELIGNVMGSRKRLALALDTDETGFSPAITERLASPHKPVKVAAKDAPVQQVVLKGEAADLCALPVHLQHGEDGAPYISAGLDVMQFRDSGHTNIGCRRIMLRGPAHRRHRHDRAERRPRDLSGSGGEGRKDAGRLCGRLDAVRFHGGGLHEPADGRIGGAGALRGAPVPIVKCVTNDIYVPADAEYVLEGYLDPKGHVEPEGPYGEYVGYYGVVKKNPVFTSPRSRTARMRCSDRHHRRQAARPHRHRAAHHGEDGVRRLGRPRHRGARAGGVLCDAVERRHVQRPRFDPPARAGRGAERHRRGVRQHGEASRCSCSTTTSTCSPTSSATGRWRRAIRATATPSRLGLPRGAARSVAFRRAHRRQDRLRLHHSVRQAAIAGVGHPDRAGDAEGQRSTARNRWPTRSPPVLRASLS
jgi:hypothetical protein